MGTNVYYKNEWWAEYCLDILPTGSSIICDPPITNTDVDYLCLLSPKVLTPLEKELFAQNWFIGGSLENTQLKLSQNIFPEFTEELFPPLKEYPDFFTGDGIFRSWKKGEINLILTCSPEYFSNFTKATRLAKKLNLLKKEDRISLFEAVTKDVWP
jgi:hypothetical protein